MHWKNLSPAIQNNHSIAEKQCYGKLLINKNSVQNVYTFYIYANLLFLSFNLKIDLKIHRHKMCLTKLLFYISFTINFVQSAQKLRMLSF